MEEIINPVVEKNTDDVNQNWNEKMVPVAKIIFRTIADNIDNAPMSVVKKVDAEASEWSKDIVKKVLEEMLKSDMRVRDDVMLLQLMIQPIAQVMERVKSSLDMNYDTAISRTFGAENQHAVTMSQLHEVLMKPEVAE